VRQWSGSRTDRKPKPPSLPLILIEAAFGWRASFASYGSA